MGSIDRFAHRCVQQLGESARTGDRPGLQRQTGTVIDLYRRQGSGEVIRLVDQHHARGQQVGDMT
ncbi:hypothetical protein A8U91_03830 [Halomonas elongata]|uniref:Uncharacterized protein n=1 Tax=Halomonas elongata TaxID=2746 RepID=A0A1B8NXP8_HALEL|nr:hypothetical protein A8U91_03830 [Halomonas elongata]